MDNCFEEFRNRAEKATLRHKGLMMPRYCKNLRYNSEGVYSYKTKIADLDFNFRTIRQRGYWSRTSSKHYNYAKRMLEMCYDFNEDSPVFVGGPTQHLP